MHRCRRLRLWQWRCSESNIRRSEAVQHVLKHCLFPICATRKYSSIVLDNTTWRIDDVVRKEARRLALANPTVPRHELSQLLVASMKGRRSGPDLEHFDAYIAVSRIHRKDPCAKERRFSQGPRATSDDYNRWINILMHAPAYQSSRGLAKRIYLDDPTRWRDPDNCVDTMNRLALYGRAQTHQNAAQDQSQILPSIRDELITTMTYRRDQVCSLNMGGVDFLGIRKGRDHLPYRHYWTEDEDNKLVELIINAYTNPTEVSRWNHGFKRLGLLRKTVGSIYLRQLQHASVRCLRHLYPLGYWYGSHRTLEEVTNRHKWILSSEIRDELNTQFQQTKGTGMRDKALRDWVTDKYHELRRAFQEKYKSKKRKLYGEQRPLGQRKVQAEDENE